MKKVLYVLPALALLPATAAARDGWYVSATAGGVIGDDAATRGPAFRAETDFDAGVSGGAALGYQFADPWLNPRNDFRLEAEFIFREADVDTFDIVQDDVTGLDLDGLKVGGGGDLQSLGFMANVFYEVATGTTIRPYITAGAGIAEVDLDFGTMGQSIVDDDDTNFAYQLGGGLNYDVTRQWTFTLGYRYFATSDPRVIDASGAKLRIDNQSHNVEIGLRYQF